MMKASVGFRVEIDSLRSFIVALLQSLRKSFLDALLAIGSPSSHGSEFCPISHRWAVSHCELSASPAPRNTWTPHNTMYETMGGVRGELEDGGWGWRLNIIQ